MLNRAFSEVLKRLRRNKGFSQERFGFKAGLHRTYVSQLERGLKSPSLETLSRISRVLGIDISETMKLVESELKRSKTERR